MDIIYNLESNYCGFFSNYFYVIFVYAICKEYNIILNIKDDKWRFKYNKGLIDYFDVKNINKINIINTQTNNKYVYSHMNVPPINYPLKVYRECIKEIYILNEDVIRKYKEYCSLIKLPKEYNAIFIRCGDKLIEESKYYSVDNYMNFLVKLDVKTKNLFIHSDDHTEVIKCIEYNEKMQLGFNIYNITTEFEKGALVIEHLRQRDIKKFENIKSVNQMNSFELKDHTEKMLCAIEILKYSQNIVTDYQSNVSRFLKLYCDCNVYNILNEEPDYDSMYKNIAIDFEKV
jgi:hypothetical protein